MEDSNDNGNLTFFLVMLTLIFISLRLIPYGNGHMINWPWVWVLAPLWIPLALFAAVVAFILIITTVIAFHRRGKK